MVNLIKQHTIAALLIGLLVIAALWYGLTQSSAAPAPVLTTTSAGAASPGDQNLVTTLLTLQAVTLDGSVLSDPGFLQLKDFTTQVVSEPVGRPNPFAPYTASAPPAVTNTTNPHLFAPVKKTK